ncbi:glycerophosphodiester phosphodiesterase family protein [Neptunomonas phycophila]|uniref:glycerophosphodiester phosphodiesterase family protein n=1 Tax=Neptunomonas phycophila TaxID=1572645 RepID=UPI0030F995F6
MKATILPLCASVIATLLSIPTLAAHHETAQKVTNVQVGPRPYFLVADMDEGPLKDKLASCANSPMQSSDFSIGHRGAPMQFPEHTKESYEAAARMGAGIIECDVTFTSDQALVCRHSQCDLHTTTNILETPLASKCSVPFQPAQFGSDGKMTQAANVQCCTSDITLAEFKTLKGKMDAGNPNARTIAEYLDATPNWRTDRYSSQGSLMTHAQSIELFKSLGVKMTPELKSASVEMPFNGFTQEAYAQKMLDEYKAAGVDPSDVWPQSFNLDDVKYWIKNEPEFAKQGVYLDDRYDIEGFDFRNPDSWSPSMEELVESGVAVIAPPLWMLVDVENDSDGKAVIVPSTYAKAAKDAGLKIIAWSLERSGQLTEGGGWYYSSLNTINPNTQVNNPIAINNEGDVMTLVDVLAQDVGVIGIFSDWPATVTYYASCMNK